jgi:hypothetical protein
MSRDENDPWVVRLRTLLAAHAQAKGFNRTDSRICSFCGKKKGGVAGPPAGDGIPVLICSDCVRLCMKIVAEQEERSQGKG